MRKFFQAALAAIFLSLPPAFAQGGTASFPFLRIDRNPATAGMGTAGAASVSSVGYAAFRNAAVIPFSEGKGNIGAGWQNWAPGSVRSTNLSLGGAFRFGGRFGVAVGGVYQAGEPYAMTSDASGRETGTFTPSEMLFSVGFAARITGGLGLGANVKAAVQNLAEDAKEQAFAADVFLLYRLPSLSVTAGVSSLGASSLPSSATAGVSFDKVFGGEHGVVLNADADYFFGSTAFAATGGVQYGFRNLVFLRCGFHFGTDAAPMPSFVTLGAGFRLAGVHIDFAYLTANPDIGNTMTAGLGYVF